MNIDPKEMAHVAAAAPADAAPRMDLYSGIHKAARALMADTLLALGRMDADDPLEVADVGHRVLELMDFCRSHLEHENTFVHPAIEARSPGAATRIANEHVDHVRHTGELAAAAAAMVSQPAPAVALAAQDLYRRLALFVADNFEHMHVEETAHNAVLWARYTDAELLAIHEALVASIPPDEMLYVARWMIPFMNPAERHAVLADMQANAPAPAFAAVLDTVRPHLSEREWSKLALGLGLSKAAARVAG